VQTPDLADGRAHQAVVVWDASWVGGALKLRRSGAKWEIESVSDWIT